MAYSSGRRPASAMVWPSRARTRWPTANRPNRNDIRRCWPEWCVTVSVCPAPRPLRQAAWVATYRVRRKYTPRSEQVRRDAHGGSDGGTWTEPAPDPTGPRRGGPARRLGAGRLRGRRLGGGPGATRGARGDPGGYATGAAGAGPGRRAAAARRR